MKILIADDELIIHDILKSACSLLGYETVCVTDGQEAWDQIKANENIRLGIIDWLMPRIDGAELCRLIRNHQDGHYRYVILLTSKGTSSDVVTGLAAGADDYIVKPFNYEELKMRILIGRRILELEDSLLTTHGKLQTANNQLEDKVAERTRQLNRLYQELKQNFLEFIRIFVTLMTGFDHNLGEHCKRVAVVAKLIGQKLSLNEAELEQLETAALLHDIGLMSIPKKIQERPFYLLNYKEQEQFKQHPVIGQSMLSTISNLQKVGQVIRSHHERYDGHGYPDGLKGERIPRAARIIKVADEYDRLKLTSIKNIPLSAQNCLNYIREYKGNILDPAIVDTFLKAV